MSGLPRDFFFFNGSSRIFSSSGSRTVASVEFFERLGYGMITSGEHTFFSVVGSARVLSDAFLLRVWRASIALLRASLWRYCSKHASRFRLLDWFSSLILSSFASDASFRSVPISVPDISIILSLSVFWLSVFLLLLHYVCPLSKALLSFDIWSRFRFLLALPESEQLSSFNISVALIYTLSSEAIAATI